MNSSVENIINEINSKIVEISGGDASAIDWNSWHIGLTVYPNQEKREQGKPAHWKSWKANSSADAAKIQKYFLDKFSINQNRVNGKYDYFIYIFKK